jgi:hypothetical protein
MLRSACAARTAMKFCDADACASCELAAGTCACLRQKAQFCLWLSVRASNRNIRRALEKLGLDLIAESHALEREKAIIARQSPTRSFYEAFGGDGLRHGNLNMTVDLNQSGSIAKGAR